MASAAAVVTMVVVVMGYFQASLPARKGCHEPYCHLSRLILVWSVCALPSCFSCVRLKIAGRNINNLRYADDTTRMAESEEELKSLVFFFFFQGETKPLDEGERGV